MNVDKNAVYPPAVDNLKPMNNYHQTSRQVEYLNKRVEQDPETSARLTKLGFCLWVSFDLNRFAGRSISPRSIEVCKEILGKV